MFRVFCGAPFFSEVQQGDMHNMAKSGGGKRRPQSG
jgi:hypothetical protein